MSQKTLRVLLNFLSSGNSAIIKSENKTMRFEKIPVKYCVLVGSTEENYLFLKNKEKLSLFPIMDVAK